MATCLIKSYPPSEVVQHTEKIINKEVFQDANKADIKFRLGQEVEKKDQKTLAAELYESALLSAPKDRRIKERLETISSGLSVKSKYDYLMKQNKITAQQLRQALSQSKRMKKSVELVLIEEFNIALEDLAKSLSLFYGCPFKPFLLELQKSGNARLGQLHQNFGHGAGSFKHGIHGLRLSHCRRQDLPGFHGGIQRRLRMTGCATGRCSRGPDGCSCIGPGPKHGAPNITGHFHPV
jgi:hypothetical protein